MKIGQQNTRLWTAIRRTHKLVSYVLLFKWLWTAPDSTGRQLVGPVFKEFKNKTCCFVGKGHHSIFTHFRRAQIFPRHAHSQRVHSASAGPLAISLYTTERETTPLFTIFTLKPPGGLSTQKPRADGSYRS